MPSFHSPPTTPDHFAQVGPLIDMSLWVPEEHRRSLNSRGLRVPSYQPVKAQIDSGSPWTFVKEGYIRKVGLPTDERRPVGGPTLRNVAQNPTYPVYIVEAWFFFPDGEWHKEIEVVEVPLDGYNDYQAIIGRNLLAYATSFDYKGESTGFRLTFP